MSGYFYVGLFLGVPPLVGFYVGFTRAAKAIAPILVSCVALAVLAWLAWVWIKPEGPCRYSDCWDEDWIAGYFAVVTIIWWSIAAGTGFLANLVGARLRRYMHKGTRSLG